MAEIFGKGDGSEYGRKARIEKNNANTKKVDDDIIKKIGSFKINTDKKNNSNLKKSKAPLKTEKEYNLDDNKKEDRNKSKKAGGDDGSITNTLFRGNYLSKISYVILIIAIYAVICMTFKKMFIEHFPQWHGNNMLKYFIGDAYYYITAGLAVLAAATSFRTHRNVLSAVTSAIAPFGVISVFGFLVYEPKSLVKVVLIGMVVIAAYLVSNIIRRRYGGKTNEIESVNTVKNIILSMLSIFVVFVFASSFSGNSVELSALYRRNSFEELYNINADTLIKLDEQTWSTLSENDKLEVLKTVANTECEMFGIPYYINVNIDENLRGTGVYSNYEYGSRSIRVNPEILKDFYAHDCVMYIIRACFNVYQRCLCEVYLAVDEKYYDVPIFDDAVKYYNSFKEYDKISNDYIAVSKLLVVETATKYSSSTINIGKYFDSKLRENIKSPDLSGVNDVLNPKGNETEQGEQDLEPNETPDYSEPAITDDYTEPDSQSTGEEP